jgi:hypothetical protein
MSALPNPLHNSEPTKKSAGRATRSGKLNKYGRDPASPSERMRVSVLDHQDYAPFIPVPASFFSDLPRLTSGKVDTWLIMAIWAKSAGRGVAPKSRPKAMRDFWEGVEPGKRPEWSLSLSTAEWAQLCHCSEKQIERDFANLQKRKLIEFEKTGPAKYRARLLFRNWEALPDYDCGVMEMPKPAEDEPELTDEQEAKPGSQRVTGKKPIRLPAGAVSKAFAVNCGVSHFQAKVEGPVDIELSAVIKAGVFTAAIRFPDDWREKVVESLKASSGINDIPGTFRRGRRNSEANVGRNPNGANIGRKSAGVDHPRAAELVTLFDPLLGKSGAVLLAMDETSLRAACEAVQDCDHDYLVKFAVNRAAVPIKRPSHVKLICAEALASWKASKVLNSAGAVTREQIDAMIAQERADLAKKRAEMRRR